MHVNLINTSNFRRSFDYVFNEGWLYSFCHIALCFCLSQAECEWVRWLRPSRTCGLCLECWEFSLENNWSLEPSSITLRIFCRNHGVEAEWAPVPTPWKVWRFYAWRRPASWRFSAPPLVGGAREASPPVPSHGARARERRDPPPATGDSSHTLGWVGRHAPRQ